MRLPNFIVIGAAKSGTTTLYRYLSQHPQVHIPKKEPNFFSMDEKYTQGIDWYASLFNGAEPHQVCGEGTTDYTKYPLFPESAARISKHLPQVKLIYMMRHPVDRAYSHYVHIGRAKKRTETFEENIQRTSVCLDSSNYMMQIEQYLKFFYRESFLFLLMEDLIEQPAQTLHQICNFIGIENTFNFIEGDTLVVNQSRKFFEDTTRSKITAPLKAILGVAPAAALLPQSWRDSVYRLLKATPYGEHIKKQYVPPPMRPETRQMLLERFKEPNQKLTEFLNRDLSHWSR